MPAPKGNQFWKARATHGPKEIFDSPEKLWDAACEYFEWVENNPLWESKLFSYQGEVTEGIAPKMRAMTIDGLVTFLDVNRSTWYEWKHKNQGLSSIIEKIESIIKQQKFAGAAADLLNSNIIARDLGLVDKKEHSGNPEAPLCAIDVSGMSDKALEELLNARKNSNNKQ